jgi:hypothetical protein
VDGGHVRALARGVHDLAEAVRAAGDRLATSTSVRWTSLAADEFRARVGAERGHVTGAARLLDEAVVALLRHAAVLDAAASMPAGPAGPAGGLPSAVRAVLRVGEW